MLVFSQENLLRSEIERVQSVDLFDWTHIRCFHGTRLPSIDPILRDGILPPSVELLAELLHQLGVSLVDNTALANDIESNGPNVFVQLGEYYAREQSAYLYRGPEKIRKYIYREFKGNESEFDARIAK